MTLAERVAALEASVSYMSERLNSVIAFETQLLFMGIAGIAAVAFLVFKAKNKE